MSPPRFDYSKSMDLVKIGRTPDRTRVRARHRAGRATLVRGVVGVVALAIAVMAPLGGAGAAPSATATPQVTFGIEPAPTNGTVTRPNFAFSATPGAEVNDRVVVVNYSSTPLELQLSATDAVETPGGGFGLLPANVTPTGVGSWITLSSGPGTVTVPPASATGPGQLVEPFVMHVPTNATPGDHVGGIVASLQTIGTNATGQRIVLDQRVGTRVFVRVSGALDPKVTVTGLHASYSGTLNPVGTGQVRANFVVTNAGNVDLALRHVTVSVSGLFGSGKKTVKLGTVSLLLPGASVTESALIKGVYPLVLINTTASVSAATVTGVEVHRSARSPRAPSCSQFRGGRRGHRRGAGRLLRLPRTSSQASGEDRRGRRHTVRGR